MVCPLPSAGFLGVGKTTAINTLIELARPDRLIIEPTGSGHPEGIIDVRTGGNVSTYRRCPSAYSVSNTTCPLQRNHHLLVALATAGQEAAQHVEPGGDRLVGGACLLGATHAGVEFFDRGDRRWLGRAPH